MHVTFVADRLSNDGDNFVDGAVIAAARTLPTWLDGDIPPIPSAERKAVKELQEECQQMLAELATTSVEDQEILGMIWSSRSPLYLMNRNESVDMPINWFSKIFPLLLVSKETVTTSKREPTQQKN